METSGRPNGEIKRNNSKKRVSKFLTYDDEDSSSSDDDEVRKKGGKDVYHPVKAKVTYLKLIEKQTIKLEDGIKAKVNYILLK